MSIDLRKYSRYLELLYNDRMDITSAEEAEDADGATTNEYPAVPQQVDVPCRISLSSKDQPSQASPAERVSMKPVIFCTTAVKVKAGDRVTVRRCHADGTVYETYEGLLAETGWPNKWETHQEFVLDMAGDV